MGYLFVILSPFIVKEKLNLKKGFSIIAAIASVIVKKKVQRCDVKRKIK